MNCGVAYRGLREAVERNLITEQEIDQSVMKLFRARFKLGMFDADDIVPYAKLPMSVVDSDRNRQIALEAAHKSVVLLKNDGILPLKKSIKKIAVIGPTANDEETLWGNYCGYNKNGVTVLQGIRNKIPEADIRYEVGCYYSPTVIPPSFSFAVGPITAIFFIDFFKGNIPSFFSSTTDLCAASNAI